MLRRKMVAGFLTIAMMFGFGVSANADTVCNNTTITYSVYAIVEVGEFYDVKITKPVIRQLLTENGLYDKKSVNTVLKREDINNQLKRMNDNSSGKIVTQKNYTKYVKNLQKKYGSDWVNHSDKRHCFSTQEEGVCLRKVFPNEEQYKFCYTMTTFKAWDYYWGHVYKNMPSGNEKVNLVYSKMTVEQGFTEEQMNTFFSEYGDICFI